MSILGSSSLLLTFAAASGYVNRRWLRLPSAVGITVSSVTLAAGLLTAGHAGWFPLAHAAEAVRQVDFQSLVLHGLLALLLFSGALFVDVSALKRWWGPIAALASMGVVISAGITALLLWLLARHMGCNLPLAWC